MEDKIIFASEYVKLNKRYLEQKEELEKQIRLDLVENRDAYPAGAEETYCFDYGDEISAENEQKLMLLESVIADRFKDAFSELDKLRMEIIEKIGHIENDPREKDSEK